VIGRRFAGRADHYLEVMDDLSTEALTPAASAGLLVEITSRPRAQPRALRQDPYALAGSGAVLSFSSELW
jgi:hypothetical protein